ncbi:unnamed protein product, partial [Didymodactylos carnosus]
LSARSMIANNLQTVLKLQNINTDDLEHSTTNSSYELYCTRDEANRIRDNLSSVLPNQYHHVWYSMKPKPLQNIEKQSISSQQENEKQKEYSGQCHFGSMLSYNKFASGQSRDGFNIKIWYNRRRNGSDPESIRIVNRLNRNEEIFISMKSIQKQVLVHRHPDMIQIVLMFCITNESSTYYRTIANSSDVLLTFTNTHHAWTFLHGLTSHKDEGKFQINWVLLEQQTLDENRSINVPLMDSFKNQYALQMLLSMELDQNHCYDLTGVYDDYQQSVEQQSQKRNKRSNQQEYYHVPFATLTPLKIIFHPLESTIGHRALRQQQFNGEQNLLLVHIRDDDSSILQDFSDALKDRIKDKMLNGIKCQDKTYRFIGSSTSQLKDLSYWFLSLENKSIDQARQLLGNFSAINNVANYIARVGQYFSTTRQTQIRLQYIEKISKPNQLPPYVTDMPDVQIDTDKKYCFTDGIGKISLGLAGLVARNLKIPLESRDDIPSAFQIRLAGCKGMLVIDYESTLDDYYIKIRPSMKKFESDDWVLEICDHSRPSKQKIITQL